MSAFLDDDIDTMLDDSPDSMTFSGVTKNVWLDDSDEVQLDANGNYTGQVIRIVVATYRTSHFPGLKIGAVVTINSTGGSKNYRVQNRLGESDRATSKVYLVAP